MLTAALITGYVTVGLFNGVTIYLWAFHSDGKEGKRYDPSCEGAVPSAVLGGLFWPLVLVGIGIVKIVKGAFYIISKSTIKEATILAYNKGSLKLKQERDAIYNQKELEKIEKSL